MFRRLYIIIAGSIAVVVAVVAVIWGITDAPEDIVASTKITGNVDEVLEVFTDVGVLEQANTQVHVNLKARNTHFQVAVGQLSDVVAWVGDDDSFVINGMDTSTTLSASPKSNSTLIRTGQLDASSDMWKQYAQADNQIEFDWLDKTNVAWSLLVVANSLDGTAPEITLSLSWKVKSSRSLLFNGLILSILLLVSCLVVRTANQSKNKQGSHWGSPKSFTDIIGNIPTFELPHSSQIPSVRQFAKLGEKINNSGSASGSILNQNVPTNSNNPFANDTQFYTSPVDNDNWRYYGDDSTNEYYENSITRTPTVTNVPATKFNVLNKLDVAPQTDGIRRLTRKELRDRKKGIFRKKNFENDHNNFDGKADV